MKKQKIALGKLSLNKERISGLTAEEQSNVAGGNISVNTIVCQVSIQVICASVACVTREPARCLITRQPVCVTNPVSIVGCPPQSLACTIETITGPSEVIH